MAHGVDKEGGKDREKHSLQLTERSSRLTDCNFIQRMLFDDVY